MFCLNLSLMTKIEVLSSMNKNEKNTQKNTKKWEYIASQTKDERFGY